MTDLWQEYKTRLRGYIAKRVSNSHYEILVGLFD